MREIVGRLFGRIPAHIICSMLILLSISVEIRVSAQDSSAFNENNFEQSIQDFAISTIEDGDKDIDQLVELLARWKAYFEDPDDFYSFLWRVYHSHVTKREPLFLTNWSNNQKWPESVPKKFVRKRDLRLLRTNPMLIDLIGQGYTNETPPFKTKEFDYFSNEWDFFNFEKGDVIADIGAGNGHNFFLFNILDLDLDLTVTELRRSSLSFMKKKSKRLSKMGFPIVKVVKAKKEESNLAVNTYDAIVVRNTLHHFSKPKEMLISIANSLNDTGMLYVIERLNLPDFKSDCGKHMTLEEIKNLMEENDYVLLNESSSVSGNTTLLAYMPRSKIQWQ